MYYIEGRKRMIVDAAVGESYPNQVLGRKMSMVGNVVAMYGMQECQIWRGT